MAKAPTPQQLADLNRRRWDSAQLLKNWIPIADKHGVARILAGRERYEYIQRKTGVPWYVIGVKHLREANCNFKGILHNGQAIVGTGRKSTIVPIGVGPFVTWEESALHAIKYMGLDKVPEWPIERVLYECERFNGFGYYWKNLPSPYIWSGTNIYQRGKYVRDGVFDPNAVDQQLGCAIVLKRLQAYGVDFSSPLLPEAPAAPQEPVATVSDLSLDPSIANPDAKVATPTHTNLNEDPLVIRRVQDLLKQRGLHIVGASDGILGRNTRAAIMSFRYEKNLLPLEPVIDEKLITALSIEDHVMPAPERAGATMQEAAAKSEPVKEVVSQGWWQHLTAKVVGIPAAISAVVGGIMENFGDAKSYLAPVKDIATSVPWWLYALALAGVAYAIYANQKKIDKTTVDAYREGKVN